MKTNFALLAALSLLIAGCGETKESAPAPEAKKPAVGDNPVMAPVEYLDAVNKGRKSAQNTLVDVGLESAIQQYFAVEGKYPAKLDELVSGGYIKEVPKDPYGRKINYDPMTGKVTVVEVPKEAEKK